MTDNENQPQATEKKETDTELSIGERIKKRRIARNLSVEQLVSVIERYDRGESSTEELGIGISVSSLYLYEKGERLPRAKEIKLICLALDISADWLLFGEAWNSEQEADSKLATDFRSLVKSASDDSWIKALKEKTTARTNSNIEIINNVKFQR
jgi:transcriptional regulator with XRE-family HTH domain